ncbi:MAG: hypothetical protein WC273_10675 [Dehalococcoidia bacterium]
MSAAENAEYLTLKWGTLKAWNFTSAEGIALLQRYFDIGSSMSAMMQHDTPEQKDIVCALIDVCRAPTIYLDWDDKEVSKEEAKEYVRSYGAKVPA